MAILHLRIRKADQNIDIAKSVHAQKLTFIRSTINKDNTATPTNTYNGTLFFDIDFFNGFEMVSNLNDNYVMVPIQNEIETETLQYDQEFSSEEIKQSFNVKVFEYNKAGPTGGYTKAVFKDDITGGGSTTGAINYVDLFFQIQSLYDYGSISY